MYELAKSARSKMKAKAERLVGSSNSQKPFYSEGENASDKTGMRPISERAYKKGGKVLSSASGKGSAPRADRIKRKAGGRIAESFVNKDVKAANKDRAGGKDHIGGLKKGGVAKKATMSKASKAATSKAAPAREPAKAVAKAAVPKLPKISESSIAPKASALAETMKPKASAKPLDETTAVTPMGEETPEEDEVEATTAMKKGGRVKRKRGGRTKGKGSNINIVIAAPQGDAGQAAMPPGAPAPRTPAPGMAPAPAMGGMPPAGMPPMGGGMPPMPPGGMPPMGPPPMRKSGGRVDSYKSLKAGSGSGLGRLKKSGIGSISS